MKKIWLIAALLALTAGPAPPGLAGDLEAGFRNPPDAVKPWVFWFWINGNISREGITKDLESMKRVGIGGVLWMEVSGPWWAPQGPIEGGSKQWHDAMQWAISEADRLGMAFAMSVDFGYGSGGPHITPDRSMQRLVWSETVVRGGKRVAVQLSKPAVDYRPALKKVWLRPGQTMNPVVMTTLKEVESYRDAAVFAFPLSKEGASSFDHLEKYDGRGWQTHLPPLSDGREENAGVRNLLPERPEGCFAQKVPDPFFLSRKEVIDVSDRMSDDGTLDWNVPEGDWTVVRLGYASNFKMTRPSPQAAVGLECDRLNPRGIDTHFEHHLKPILDAAGEKAGRTLQYIHIDSWEAHGQNWTDGFAEEFRKRRGYNIEPWLPVL